MVSPFIPISVYFELGFYFNYGGVDSFNIPTDGRGMSRIYRTEN